MNLETIIHQRIEKNGPLTVAEYMTLALTHPEHGYYMGKDPLGVRGDFITAPEISQIFGELIAAWLAEQWRAMGKPKAALVELGPGRGTLMADILRTSKKIPDFHASVTVHLVEASPALKQKQWQQLAGQHSNIEWHRSVDELPDKPWLLVANEFFDALPVRQFMQQDGQWHERMVGAAKGKLRFVLSEKAENSSGYLREWLNKISASERMIVEYCEPGMAIARTIAAHVKERGGMALIIDYGYTQGSRGDTLQAVKAHQHHDPLAEPGSADLTCHVDFSALKRVALAEGATAHGPVIQGIFLKNLGAIIRAVTLSQTATPQQKASLMSGVERLVSVEHMGDLFKALCIAPLTHPKPEGF